MSRVRACAVCGSALPATRPGKAKLCDDGDCKREYRRKASRERARAKAAAARAAKIKALAGFPPRVCSECGGPLPALAQSHRITCGPDCAKARHSRLKSSAWHAAKPPPSVADAPPAVDWSSVLSRAAASGGPEFAQALARELNKHRRLNGHPEVRA